MIFCRISEVVTSAQSNSRSFTESQFGKLGSKLKTRKKSSSDAIKKKRIFLFGHSSIDEQLRSFQADDDEEEEDDDDFNVTVPSKKTGTPPPTPRGLAVAPDTLDMTVDTTVRDSLQV